MSISSLSPLLARAAIAVFAILLSITEATPLPAQSLTRGTLQGLVRDSAGEPLFDVRLGVRDPASGASRTITSDRAGRFTVGFLPSGTYELRAERFGYRPLLVSGIGISAGQVVSVPLVLGAGVPPVESVDSVRFAGAVSSSAQPGIYQAFGPLELHRLPQERREVLELARMSSASSEELILEGLPATMNGLLIDGVLVRPVPGAGGAGPRLGALFPLAAFDGGRLIAGYPDAEWFGVAGGGLNMLSRPGTDDFRVGAFGSWSRADLDPSGAGDPLSGSLRGLQGGAVVSGPILGDTASFIAGVEFWSLDEPVSRPLGADSIGREIVSVAEESFGVPLEDLGESPTVRSDVISLFGRFDWQLSPAHSVTVGGMGSLVGAPSSELGALATTRSGSAREGRDIVATATLLSRLGDRLVQELRFNAQNSTRESPAAPSVIPTRTTIGASGVELGLDGHSAGSFDRTVFQGSGAWHLDLAPHRLKLGASAGIASYDRDPAAARWGGYRFAGPEELAGGEGAFAGSVGPISATSFSLPRFGVFLQDRWTASEGLELTLGLRYDLELLPSDDVRPDPAWFERTGLLNADVPGSIGALSPRFGFVWDVGNRQRWVVHGTAGRFAGLADPEHISSLLADDGTLEVRRGVGDLEGWPAAPDESVAPVQGPSLTLLAPGYRGARTTRGSLGVTHFLDSRTALHLTGVYRQTDHLPRRADLNLAAAPTAADAFGRPIYGTLVKQGAMLVPEPGSNRRFSDFDIVSAINADGSSTYQGVTLAVERRASDRLNLFGSYTYSRTEDDWLTGAYGAGLEIAPFAGTPDADWVEGTSDFDVPHRLALGGELRLDVLRGVRVAGLYRYRSGRPFTPGFGEMVDANGDGSASNDPAFVSDAIPGMEPLLERWDCLREQVGGFAERNSCRSDATHTLDLRLAVQLGSIAGSPAELFVDGLDLTGGELVVPDTRLYQVDPEAELRIASDGTVTVPLLANESFGNPLIRYAAGRQLRVGLKIDY